MYKYCTISWLMLTIFVGCQRNLSVNNPILVRQFKVTNVASCNEKYKFTNVGVCPLFFNIKSVNTQMINDLNSVFFDTLLKSLKYRWQFIQQNAINSAKLFDNEHVAVSGSGIKLVKEKYAVDGMLITEITMLDPYTPVKIGIRMKLVDIDSLNVLWSADEFFDSSDAAIQNALDSYYKTNSTNIVEVFNDNWLNSPSALATYAFNAIVNKL